MFEKIFSILMEEKDFFLHLLGEHLVISLVSIAIAIVVGGMIGIFISEFKKTSKITLGGINFLYTIPSISLLGFLIPFSGVGNLTAIIALIIYALLPMVRNTYIGLTNIDPAIVEAARGLGSTRLQTLFKIKIPLAMPVILSGVRNMATMTIALAGIASFIGAGGLGVAIYRGITTNNATMTIAGSFLIAFLALFFDVILGFIEKNEGKRNKSNKFIMPFLLILVVLVMGSTFFHTKEKGIIHIATKPMTEQYIIGNMLETLIKHKTGLKVILTQGVGGGTSNIQPGMEKGEFDIYPEYTGTAWEIVLKKEESYGEDKFTSLVNNYENDFHMQWKGMYGFNNTYALAVRKEIAEKYKLKNISDLGEIANKLVFGGEYDFFGREDGYDALCKAYGLSFKENKDMDIGLKYKAMAQKKIDIMPVFTTDGQLSNADVIVLKDDKKFFPSYRCGNVVRDEILKKYPELEKVFNLIENTISDADMAKMNHAVEIEKKDPHEVAIEFLKTNRLLN